MFLEHGRVRAGKQQLTAEFARTGAQIDDAIRSLDGVRIVFHNQHGVPQVAQRFENINEPLRVAGMQADRGFIEHVERANQMGTERRRELDALRFSTRERGRQTIQREVIEAYLVKKLQTSSNLFENPVRDFLVSFRELQRGKESTRLFDAELADLSNRFSRHTHRASLGSQTSSPAIRTGRVASEAAEKNAHVQLVFFAFQPGEKSLDALVVVLWIAFENQAPLFSSELAPRHVRGNSAAARPFFCVLEEHTVTRLGPRFDGAVVERLARIGNDQIQIEIDGISEALTTRTRAVRIVERKKPRLGFLVESAVVLAFESLVECNTLGRIPRSVRDEFEDGLALPFAVTNFDGVHEPRA